MFVRLTSKLANVLNGMDVSDVRVGDVLDLSRAQATMLIANGWAEMVPEDDTATEQPRRARTG